VALINLSDQTRHIRPGDRIAQMVIARYERVQWKEVEELAESRRGEGGFGHTGVSAHT
jgi:dUTP pyrophosphatase